MGLFGRKWRQKFKDLTWSSYIWLGYLPYSVAMYLPVNGWQNIVWLSLLGCFLILYVLVIEKPAWRRITIPLELVVTGLFAIWGANNYMIIFPGWQVAFILGRGPKKYFYQFITGYYAMILMGLMHDVVLDHQLFSWQNGAVVGLIFPLLSPIMAYTFTRSIWRQRQLQQTNRRLQAIIQRDERERIARDLHDTLGQSFSMITLKTELAKKLLVKAPERVAAELTDIEQTSRQNLQLVRSIVNDLHQQSLSEMLLNQSRNLVAANVWLTTIGESAATQWPTRVQGVFAEALVEAMTNVIRHAQARNVFVTFQLTDQGYHVQLQDDGKGGTLSRPNANGIQGMRTRMLNVHGTFAIEAQAHGTRVTLSLPKEENVK